MAERRVKRFIGKERRQECHKEKGIRQEREIAKGSGLQESESLSLVSIECKSFSPDSLLPATYS